MSRVIISAGHTQNEPGAVVDDLREVDLTHTIASKITSRLRQKGIITLSVPPELDLTARIGWINKTGYKEESDDICIEIHINDGGKTGIEGWFKDRGGNISEELTKTILEQASKATGLTNQGSHSELDHPLKKLAFLHDTNPTSTLLECLYIDNPDDQKFLKDDAQLDKLATGIVKGILVFFSIEEANDAVAQQPSISPGAAINPVPTTKPPIYPTMPAFQPSAYAQPYTPPSYYDNAYFGMPKTSNLQMTREERKKMIQDKYEQILGRKVNDQDINYFLSLNLSEDQMIKRIVESQEHADLVRDALEYKKIKPEFDRLKIEEQRHLTEIKDKEQLLIRQNDLIAQKSKKIQEIQGGPAVAQQQFTSPAIQQPALPEQTVNVPAKRRTGFFDRILKKLNDIFD